MSVDKESNDVDYGPLAGLIGTWHGDKGMDVSPEPDGKEENPWGIIQSPFIKEQARTMAFERKIVLTEGCHSYTQTTTVEIYGKTFEQSDANQLKLT